MEGLGECRLLFLFRAFLLLSALYSLLYPRKGLRIGDSSAVGRSGYSLGNFRFGYSFSDQDERPSASQART